MKKALRISVVLVVAAFAACNTITQPQSNNPGDFTADFINTDGTATFFDATNAKAFVTGSMYTVNATQLKTAGTANLTLSGVPSSSSVPYTVSSAQSSTLKVSYHDAENNKDYFSNIGGGSCSVTITQTSSSLIGTLTGRLVNSNIADSVRTVTSASFNATLQ